MASFTVRPHGPSLFPRGGADSALPRITGIICADLAALGRERGTDFKERTVLLTWAVSPGGSWLGLRGRSQSRFRAESNQCGAQPIESAWLTDMDGALMHMRRARCRRFHHWRLRRIHTPSWCSPTTPSTPLRDLRRLPSRDHLDAPVANIRIVEASAQFLDECPGGTAYATWRGWADHRAASISAVPWMSVYCPICIVSY